MKLPLWIGVVALAATASLVVPATVGAQTVSGTIDGRVVITNHANFQTTSTPTQPGSYFVKYPSTNFGAATAIIPNSQREAEFGARFRF